MSDWYSAQTARKILASYKTFAVVGYSPDPARPSWGVASFLKSKGYKVIPVNPSTSEIMGDCCYPDLASVPDEIEVVDLFRRSDKVLPHVEEAIEIGAKAIWMQLGVVNEEAAQRAQDAGLDVVMDRCPAIDHPRLFGAA